MKMLNGWLFVPTLPLFTAVKNAAGQSPPSLTLRLFAGVNITGTVGSVYVVQFIHGFILEFRVVLAAP